jgi:hypothetical protein
MLVVSIGANNILVVSESEEQYICLLQKGESILVKIQTSISPLERMWSRISGPQRKSVGFSRGGFDNS